MFRPARLAATCVLALACLLPPPAIAASEAEVDKVGAEVARKLRGMRLSEPGTSVKVSYNKATNTVNMDMRFSKVSKDQLSAAEIARIRADILRSGCANADARTVGEFGLHIRVLARDRSGRIMTVATVTKGYC